MDQEGPLRLRKALKGGGNKRVGGRELFQAEGLSTELLRSYHVGVE